MLNGTTASTGQLSQALGRVLAAPLPETVGINRGLATSAGLFILICAFWGLILAIAVTSGLA